MSEYKFNIGDEVEVVGVQSGLFEAVGMVGTVVNVPGRIVVVQFPERFSHRLHSGSRFGDGFSDPTCRCWNFERRYIRPVISIDFTPDIGSLL